MRFYARRTEIERAVGAAGTVSREPLDETARRASRVAIYHPGNVYDEPEIVPALTEWALTSDTAPPIRR